MKSKTPDRRAPLSRERILRAALDVVDREGLDAISMRRVGEALGVEAMSLYHHVASKAAMLDGVFETVLAELPAPPAHSAWQLALRERCRALRDVLRAHPNVLPLFATRPAVTPASIAHVEATLETLRAAGFGAEDALSAMQTLLAFVVGHTVATYAPRRAEEDSRPAYEALDPQRFPRVLEAVRVMPGRDLEAEFEFGLEAMLTGLEHRAAGRPGARPRRR